jgi:hypothetical protein
MIYRSFAYCMFGLMTSLSKSGWIEFS